MLVRAARSLAVLPVEVDDATLTEVLGEALLPTMGDAVALYEADESGVFHLTGAAPGGALPTRRADEPSGQRNEIAVSLVDEEQPDCLLVIRESGPARQYDDADHAAVEVIGALITARRAVRQRAELEAELREQVEAMAHAGRELAHLLNNDLTMPVGVIELLLDRNDSTPDLQEMLRAAAHDLGALEQHVRAFHEQMRVLASRLES